MHFSWNDNLCSSIYFAHLHYWYIILYSIKFHKFVLCLFIKLSLRIIVTCIFICPMNEYNTMCWPMFLCSIELISNFSCQFQVWDQFPFSIWFNSIFSMILKCFLSRFLLIWCIYYINNSIWFVEMDFYFILSDLCSHR